MTDWSKLTEGLIGADVTVHAEAKHEGVVLSTFSSETRDGQRFDGMIIGPVSEYVDNLIQTIVWIPFDVIAKLEVYP
jgi:hypothetical protein